MKKHPIIIISVNTHSSHNNITFQGYSALDVHVIDLVQDQCHGQFEEAKISSSSLRKRLLGTLINPVKVFANYLRNERNGYLIHIHEFGLCKF